MKIWPLRHEKSEYCLRPLGLGGLTTPYQSFYLFRKHNGSR